jgi:DNA-binding FadR family transcriptional regulator
MTSSLQKIYETKRNQLESAAELSLDRIPNLDKEDPNYEKHKKAFAAILKHDPEQLRAIMNWD